MAKPEQKHTAQPSGFDPCSREDWERLVARTLGDGALADLTSTTHDGIECGVLDAAGEYGDPASVPGLRAAAPAVRTLIAEPDPAAANAAIHAEIAGGADEILLQIEAPGQAGVRIAPPDLGRLLDGIAPGSVDIHLRHPAAPDHCYAALIDWLESGPRAGKWRGGFGIDTLGAVASGALDPAWLDEDKLTWDAQAVRTGAARAPHASVLTASGLPYHEAGASEAQELAAMLATGLAYLRACDDHGVALADAALRIALELAADADMFLTIAKLRAARLLWARVLEACGIDNVTVRLDVQTSARMMCTSDPYINMDRVTAAALAAGIGGADASIPLAFTHPIGQPDAFARRIARNTLAILAGESLIGSVDDAAGGSWTIERLTGALCGKAWSLFQEIEAEGGMIRTLASGALAARIGEVREARARDIAAGRTVLVGATDYRPTDLAKVAAEPWSVPPPVRTEGALRPVRLEPDGAR